MKEIRRYIMGVDEGIKMIMSSTLFYLLLEGSSYLWNIV
jgi:hypothetical protein